MRNYRRRQAKICECGDTAFVLSTRVKTIIFDAVDFDRFSKWNWSAAPQGHVYRRMPKSQGGFGIFMHSEVIGKLDGHQVDHINGNPCDNRSRNLRHATKAQNQMNRHAVVAGSGYKGVTPNKKRWAASIRKRTPDGVKIHYHLGTYDTKEQAALVYDYHARELFGAYAKPNFPDVFGLHQ